MQALKEFLFLTFFNNILILIYYGFYLHGIARLVAPAVVARHGCHAGGGGQRRADVGMAIAPAGFRPDGCGCGFDIPPVGGPAPIRKQRNSNPTCLGKAYSNYPNYKMSTKTYRFIVSLSLIL
jgi:hypothetical protein